MIITEGFGHMLMIDLSSYDDKRSIENFLDWLKNTEFFFNYMNTPKTKKVHLVTLKWWGQTEVNRRRKWKKTYCFLGENEEVDEGPISSTQLRTNPL